MKINSFIKITGRNVMLVPYRKCHVLKYHEWMKSEELQRLTASEPLSLEEEYTMQQSWREDEDKCTFIILDKQIFEDQNDEIGAMIGDTNIFITDKANRVGEIEIMLAEESARGKKFGWEAVILMLLYGVKCIDLKKYEAKISLRNKISIKMFEKLQFVEKSRSDVFEEITLEKDVSHNWLDWLDELCEYKIEEHAEHYRKFFIYWSWRYLNISYLTAYNFFPVIFGFVTKIDDMVPTISLCIIK